MIIPTPNTKLNIFAIRVSHPANKNAPPSSVDPMYPDVSVNHGDPPSTIVAPPMCGSIVILSIRPPVSIACVEKYGIRGVVRRRVRLSLVDDMVGGGYTDSNDMAQFVPANGEEFERVDEVSNDWYVPESEDDDRHSDDLAAHTRREGSTETASREGV